MAITNHYATLGVARDADPEVIKAAYRALAKKYHPDLSSDKSPRSVRLFRQIAEAHSVLSDSRLRAQYESLLDAQEQHPGEKTPVPPRYAQNDAEKPGWQGQRGPLEKARNALVVIGWFSLGGFVLVLVAAIILIGIVGALRA